MNYYIIRFSEEYSTKNCKLGIVDGININEYLVKDEIIIPCTEISKGYYFFEEPLGINADFQMMYFSWRLLSKKMYEIISDYYDDKLMDICPLEVKYGSRILKYYVLIFKKKNDYINYTYSKIIDNKIWHCVLTQEKYPFPNIFCLPRLIGQSFCISEEVMNSLNNRGILGAEFEKINIM